MFKGLTDTFGGTKAEGTPEAHTVSEFDEEYKHFHTIPEWTQNILDKLRTTIRVSESAVKDNVVATTSFLKLLDDPRSQKVVQELAGDLNEAVQQWHSTEANDVGIMRKAEAFASRFQGIVQQVVNDINARNRALNDLNVRRGKLDQRLSRVDDTRPVSSASVKPQVAVLRSGRDVERNVNLEDKIVKTSDDVEALRGKYDVLNRQAISGMRKVAKMCSRVVYAVLYAYTYYQHNALGMRPARMHAERFVERHPDLASASNWDEVDIYGQSAKSIMTRDDMANAADVRAA